MRGMDGHVDLAHWFMPLSFHIGQKVLQPPQTVCIIYLTNPYHLKPLSSSIGSHINRLRENFGLAIIDYTHTHTLIGYK